MAAPGAPSAAQFRNSLAHGILLTKHSRSNTPSLRLVHSPGGDRLAWKHVDTGRHWKRWVRPVALRSSAPHIMVGLVYFHPGTPSADWFGGEVPPPPLSFAIRTTTRLVRLTAPSLEVYVACLHGFEALLDHHHPSAPQHPQAPRRGKPAAHAWAAAATDSSRPALPLLPTPASRARLLADGSVDVGVMEPHSAASYTFELAVPLGGFLALYDSVLASQCPSGVGATPWALLGQPHDASGSEVACLSRRVATRHTTTLKIPGFKKLAVAKTMAVFASTSHEAAPPQQQLPFGDRSRAVAAAGSGATLGSNSTNRSSSSSNGSSSPACLLVLEANRFFGAMYADYFVVYARFAVAPIDADASGGVARCTVTLSTCIAFLSTTFLQGIIVAEFLKHAPWVHHKWAALAQEHLTAGTASAAHASPLPLEELVHAATKAAGGGGSSSSSVSSSASAAVAAAAQLDLGATLRHSPVGRALSRAMAANAISDPLSPQGAAVSAPTSTFGPVPPPFVAAPAEALEGFICPMCGSLSGSQGGLVAHYTAHHMDDALRRIADSDSDSSDGGGGGSDGGSDGRRDLGRDSGGPQSSGSSPTSPLAAIESPAAATGFVCPECYGKFGSAKELTLHYAIQHGDTHPNRTPSSLPGGATAGHSGAEKEEGVESVSDAMVRDLRASVDSMASLFTAEWA